MQKQELKSCPFCGGEVEQVLMSIICKGCSAMTSFNICSITSHAQRLYNTRHQGDAAAVSLGNCTIAAAEVLQDAFENKARPVSDVARAVLDSAKAQGVGFEYE